MTKNVIAFVGENANRILECQSRRFMALLAKEGLKTHVLKLQSPDFASKLQAILSDGVLFAWGYAGIGARLQMNGQNLWQSAQTPFVSAMFDPPFMMPANHHVAAGFVVNGYAYQDWLDLQQSVIRSNQIAALLPMGVLPNPGAGTPWSKRSNRMVFVKTSGNPTRQRDRWQTLPPAIRAVLNDCADTLATKPTCAIYPVVQSVLLAHSLVLDGARHLLLGLLNELDSYMRNLRATKIAEALLPLPVDIIGSGWDHLSSLGGRARFHSAIDADAIEDLYADTKILVNASPNFSSGAHERVLRGFAAGCRIISDDNEYSRRHLTGLPSYSGFEWHDPDLRDRLAEHFHDPTSFDDRVGPAQDYVARRHDPAAFIDAMRQLAEVARLQQRMLPYALDAA